MRVLCFRYLDLHGNQLVASSGLFPVLVLVTTLTYLDLSDCQLHAAVLPMSQFPTTLQYEDVGCCRHHFPRLLMPSVCGWVWVGVGVR